MEVGLAWQSLLVRYCEHVFIVEGKKDAQALYSLGFSKVYTLHENGVSLRERIEFICHQLSRKDKVCILTDLDKKGKQLYVITLREMQAFGVRLDKSLRDLLARWRVSHVEGLDSFIETHTI